MKSFLLPRFMFLWGMALWGLSSPAFTQNSTRKIRQAPSALAAKAGTFVDWRDNLDLAIKEAKRTHKPVFWYVPTLQGSFMDRRPEIDRYMMAGPFSWPLFIQQLNENYIPVRVEANEILCKRFHLAPVSFIEPGFLILNPSGKETLRRDRITTFHPAWFETQLGQSPATTSPFPGKLPRATASILYHQLPGLDGGKSRFEALIADFTSPQAAEACWLYAAGLRNIHQEEAARNLLHRLVEQYSEEILGPKAAMELEGHGPFWRGFESYDLLPTAALAPATSGTLAPKGAFTEETLKQHATTYLLRCQEQNGSWRDSRYDFGGTDSLPNVYTAVTAIDTLALLTTKPDSHTSKAISQALHFLTTESALNLSDQDELIWAYLYRTHLYCRMLQRQPELEATLLPLLDTNVNGILKMQSKSGAWYHEYENPFITASCLIALHEASLAGVHPPTLEKVVQQGLVALESSRSPKGSYRYSQGRGKVRAPVEASAGRSPVGELARQLWGVGGKKDLETAVAHSFRDQEPLLLARKYDDHTNNYAYGGFFFWYAMLGRTQAIAALPAGATRKKFKQQQHDLVLALPEIDGAFVDSHELGRCYGTGMALWCLDLLEKL